MYGIPFLGDNTGSLHNPYTMANFAGLLIMGC